MGGLPIIIRQFERRVIIWILVCYIAAMFVITLGVRSFDNETHIALNPFHEYLKIVRVARDGYIKSGFSGALRRLWIYRHVLTTPILNILLFIPLGYLVPMVFPCFRSWQKMLFSGLVFSLIIESVQLVTHLGWFDVSDLMHNALGTGIGYWIHYRWLYKGKTIMTPQNN